MLVKSNLHAANSITILDGMRISIDIRKVNIDRIKANMDRIKIGTFQIYEYAYLSSPAFLK